LKKILNYLRKLFPYRIVNINKTIKGSKKDYLLVPKNKYIIKKREDIDYIFNHQGDVAIDNSMDSWDTFWEDKDTIDEYLSEERNKNHKSIYNFIKKFIKKGRLIDVGCGSGSFLKILNSKTTKNNIELYGTDFSESSIKHCKNNIKDMEFTVQNIFNIEYDDNYFDYTICMETLEHLEFPNKALKELYRITKNNGYIFITIPNGNKDNYIGHINFWGMLDFKNFINKNLKKFYIEKMSKINKDKNLIFVIKKIGNDKK
jgi:ubiquinone/menaquinone biosynthesis C-methylase UbiE